jgi:hypothetical protein
MAPRHLPTTPPPSKLEGGTAPYNFDWTINGYVRYYIVGCYLIKWQGALEVICY